MIKVLELFAGIGACSKALTNLGIEHEIVDAVEIDKYAIKSFNAVHGTSFEPQDISKWDKDLEVDLIMHGSPCQDFSVAGLGKGGDEGSGTRSSLMYETIRIVEKLQPKYVIWENVKNLIGSKHKHNFDAYLTRMEELGYNNHYKVLNAKNYGIPQNRERIFTVSIRKNVEVERPYHFDFPDPIPLEKRLKDMLDENVDEKYYLSDEAIRKMRTSTFHQAQGRENTGDVCGTLLARDYKDPQCVRIEDLENKEISNTVRASGRGSVDRHSWDLVADPQCIRVGGLYDKDGEKHQAGSIYDKNGLCPTMSTMGGGNQQPIIVDDMYANREPREYTETAPTLRSERSGLKVAEPQIIDPQGRKNKVCVPRDDCPTLRAQTHGNPPEVIEPYAVASRGRGENNEQHLEPRKDGVTNTLTSVQKDNYVATPYRIRKLTPCECWKLMGFTKEDFAKAEKVNSNTQLYKQAGNSIVVNVLESILGKLLQ